MPIREGQLHLLAPAGIGDLAWAWTKLHALASSRDVTFWFPQSEQKRAGFLAQMYGVKYGYLEHLTTTWVWSQPGEPDIPDTGGVLAVHPNRHLEAGKRIEKWYPDLPFANPAPETKAALFRTTVGNPPYVVAFMCHFGYMEGNLLPGLWAKLFYEIERTIAPVLIVAADADVAFAEKVCEIFDPTMAPCFNAPLAEVCTILKNARAMIGVASGIAILSTYYGIPTVSAYPRHLAAMPGTWEHAHANTAACFVDEVPFVGVDLLSRLLARVPHLLGSTNGTGRGDVETLPELVSEVHDERQELDQPAETERVVAGASSNGTGIPIAPWLQDPGIRHDPIGGRD